MSLELSGHKFQVGDKICFPNSDCVSGEVIKLVTDESDPDYQKALEKHLAVFGFDFREHTDGGSILGNEPGPVYLIKDEDEDVTPAFEAELWPESKAVRPWEEDSSEEE